MLVILLIPALADAQSAALDESALLKQAFGFARAGDKLFVSTTKGIYVLDDAGEITLAAAAAPTGQLIGDGERLYVWDHRRGNLTHWAWEGDCLTPAEVYPLDWRDFNEASERRVVVGAALTPEYGYLLIEGDKALTNDLLVFELQSGQCYQQSATNAHAIAAYQGDSILMACYDFASMSSECEIKIFSPEERSVSPYAEGIGVSPVCLLYDTIENCLLLESDGIVYALAEGDMRIVANLTGTNLASNRSACRIGDLYVTQDIEQGAVAVPLRMEGIQPKTLHFAGHRSIDAQFNPAFSQAHPEVIIQYREDSASADFVRELMTNTNAADIYTFSSSSPVYRAAIEKGYAADLSESDAIAGMIARMYPQYADAVRTKAGDIAAVPLEAIASPTLISLNASAWQRAQMGDVPKTLSDYLKTIRYFAEREDLQEAGFLLFGILDAAYVKREILQTITQCYISSRMQAEMQISMNTPEMHEMLREYEQTIPAVEKICDSAKAYYQEEFPSGMGAVTLYSSPGADLMPSSGFLIPNEQKWIFLPLVFENDDTPIIPVNITMFIVNAGSPNYGLAIEYLEHYVANLDAFACIYLFPEADDPIAESFYEGDKLALESEREDLEAHKQEAGDPQKREEIDLRLVELDEMLTDLEKNKWNIPPESVEQYKMYAPYIQVYKDTGINFFMCASSAIIRLLNQYVDGALDADSFILRYDQMVRMIYDEMQ